MLRLATFGGLSVANASASDVAVPRRRLALLALLANAGDRGLTRDKLVAYLWPESSADDARHSLEQLLYSLRRQLGPRVLAGTDPLRLSPDVIASDVATFAAALERCADDEAVAAYAGPFLDGFYLKDADEFGRWVEEERARLSADYGRALERLADRAARQGDSRAAVNAWRRLLALDRLSARYVLGLLRSLASAGDRPEALRVAASYEVLVRKELGIPLEQSIATFVESLRNGHGNVPGTATNEARAPSTPVPPADHSAPPVVSAPPRAGSGSPHSFPRVRIFRTVATIAGISGLLGIIWATSPTSPTPSRSPASGRQVIAVTPFENRTGETTLDVLGIMVADYTRIALNATGLIDVVGASFDQWQLENARPATRASDATLLRQTGATIVVRGAFYREGDSLSFTGEGIDTRTGHLIFGLDSVRVGVASWSDAVEQVRQKVMSAIATDVDPALTPWAGNAGRPPIRFDAYREFAEGMTNFVSATVEQGRGNLQGEMRLFNSARDHLQQAIHLDSTYSAAALWLFWARHNVGDRAGADSVLGALERRKASMSKYERTLYNYNFALVHGTPDQRYQMDTVLVDLAPASEFRFCLIRDALESHHALEALETLAALDDSYSWMRFMRPPSGFRVRALAQQGKYKRAIAEARAIHDKAPDDLTPAYPEIDALTALGRIDDIEPVVERFRRPTGSVEPKVANLMLYAGLRLQEAGRAAPARNLFTLALAAYEQRVDGHLASGADLYGRARSFYYLEQWDSARDAFERVANAPVTRLRYDRKALLFLGSLAKRRHDSDGVSRFRGLLDSSSANPAVLLYFDARVAAVGGDNDKALRLLANAVDLGAQAEEVVTEGDAAAPMDPDFSALRRLPAFRKAAGHWY